MEGMALSELRFASEHFIWSLSHGLTLNSFAGTLFMHHFVYIADITDNSAEMVKM